MAHVGGITDSNFILLSDLVSRQGAPLRPSPLQPDAVNQPPAVTAAPIANATQQNELQINDSLRNLGFAATVPAETLLFNLRSPLLTSLQATQELNITQQNALQNTGTLQNLNFVPAESTNPLLINNIFPILEAAEIIPELNFTQQNELLINETLLDLDIEPSSGVTVQPQPSAVLEVETTEEEIGTTLTAATRETVGVTLTDTGLVTTTGVAAAVQPTPLPTPTPTVATTGVTIPITATFLSQRFNPATLPVSLFPDRTPYVHVVHLFKDPAPPPVIPEPINREIPLTTPVAKARPLGNALLRQIVRRKRERGPMRNISHTSTQSTIALAEKHIRYTLDQVNSDMAAQGLPLHLVFAMREDEIAFDVYDCSYDEGCLLSYEIPIKLDKLTGVLDNLQHETGIIVNTTS